MENSQNKRPNRYAVLVTYLIAVVCLLLGLFLPFFGDKGILALQIPDLFNHLANKDIEVKNPFLLSHVINFFGSGKSVDIMAWIVLLYLAVTACSLLALIPIGISTKKDTKTATVFAYIVEIAAVVVTTVYVLTALLCRSAGAEVPASNISYSMLVALGGSLIMLIVLCVLNKKVSSVPKIILFLLSAVGVLALFDFSLIIPKLADIKLAPALFGNEITGTGIYSLNFMFAGGYRTIWQMLPETKEKAALAMTTAVAIIVLLNYFIDLIGLSTNAKKSGHVFNMARYALEIIAIICLLIIIATCSYTMGVMLVVLPVAALIQLVISLVRFLVHLKKEKKAEDEPEIEYAEPIRPYVRPAPIDVEPVQPVQPAPQPAYAHPEPVYMQPERQAPQPARDNYGFNEPAAEEPRQMEIMDIEPEPAKPEEKANQPVPVQSAPRPAASNEQENQPRIYTINTIYGGPVDDFMKKLTNDERIEFAMAFIERSKGNIGNIPEYVIGGNNRLFFSSVFIYLGRIRGIISDGLLNKMYKELNML